MNILPWADHSIDK